MVPLCFGVLSLPGCAHRTGGALDFPTFSCITDLLKIKCLYSEFMLTLKVLVLNSQKKKKILCLQTYGSEVPTLDILIEAVT